MKIISIGEKEYNLVTGTEINYNRFVVFEKFFLQIVEDINVLNANNFIKNIQEQLDNENIIESKRLLENLRTGILLKDNKNDAWGLCFALICSENNEDLSVCDEDFLKSKIEKFSKEGLTFDVTKKEVLNFMKPSV
jgi:hypothetical protein